MIIYKHANFSTEEDVQYLEQLSRLQTDHLNKLRENNQELKRALDVGDEKRALELSDIASALISEHSITPISEEIKNVYQMVEERYIASFNGSYEAIMADIQEILEAITKADYEAYSKRRLSTESKHRELVQLIITDKEERGLDIEAPKAPKRYRRGYETCSEYLFSALRVQFIALEANGFSDEEALTLIDKKTQTYYKKPRNAQANIKGNASEANSALWGGPNYSAAMNPFFPFNITRQGPVTNTFTKAISKRGKNTHIDKMGTATIEQGGLSIKYPDFLKMTSPLKTSTHKLLDALTVAFTEAGAKSPEINISLDEYMSKCDLKDKKEARKQAKADLEALFNARLSFKYEKQKGQPQDYKDIRIGESKGIYNGIISFTLGATFHAILTGYPIMPYPPQLWRLNANKNPNSYYLLRKISEHKNMNAGKPNEDIIAVKTLLSCAPFLPSYEEVMAKDRRVTPRIIDPFIRDMDELADTLSWHFCHRNNTPLTEEELKDFTYALFVTLRIRVYWNEYPDQTARLEAKAKTAAKRKRAEQRKALAAGTNK